MGLLRSGNSKEPEKEREGTGEGTGEKNYNGMTRNMSDQRKVLCVHIKRLGGYSPSGILVSGQKLIVGKHWNVLNEAGDPKFKGGQVSLLQLHLFTKSLKITRNFRVLSHPDRHSDPKT